MPIAATVNLEHLIEQLTIEELDELANKCKSLAEMRRGDKAATLASFKLDPCEVSLLEDGLKLLAIKSIRNRTGLDLRTCKNICDDYLLGKTTKECSCIVCKPPHFQGER